MIYENLKEKYNYVQFKYIGFYAFESKKLKTRK